MLELQITSDFAEPVLIDEVKVHMGFPSSDSSQDALISTLISAARKFVEDQTSLSVVSKSYKARFEKEDADSEGYFWLPVSPVTTTPVVSVNGAVTDFLQKGLEIIRVKPNATYSTVTGNESSYYCDVTFTAGRVNETANTIIKGIVADLFNNRNSENTISMGRLSYNVVRMINSISLNLGL